MSSSTLVDESRFFLHDEVLLHNKKDDAWVVIHGRVIDVTEVFLEPMSNILKHFLALAGKDLSYLFHKDGNPKTRINVNGTTVPLLPAAFFKSFFSEFWWRDPELTVGYITIRPRKVRIINTLTSKIHLMIVCEEDTLQTIRMKYKKYNWHLDGYHWNRYDPKRDKYFGLCFDRTLTENGFRFDGDTVPPSIWLKYKNDGSVA